MSKPRPTGRREPRPAPSSPAEDGLERLQKVLAAAGLGSRRSCEELITTGRVEVDRQVVSTLGTKVDPRVQEIRVDGEKLPDPSRVVYLLNKPVGVVTTNFDPTGRPRVVDLVPGERRLFAIGRLDRMSEGLILVTNDGDLANRLAHPRYGVEKKYHVQLAGVPSEETLDKLRRGVPLAEGVARVRRVAIRSQHKQSSVLEMVLDEGKNREIRRMLAALGHKVHQLKRVAVGSLSLGDLLPGQWRRLGWEEIRKLREESVPSGDASPAGRGPRSDARPNRRQGARSQSDRKPGDRRPGDRRPGGGRPGGPRTGKPAREGRAGSGRVPVGKQGVGSRRKRIGKASDWRRAKDGRPAAKGDA